MIDQEIKIVSMDEKKINEAMSRFVQEVKRKDGIEYPLLLKSVFII